ncbi:MAG: glycosyltransferase [Bacteroidota bacterium]
MGLIFYSILILAIGFSGFYGWLIWHYQRAWQRLAPQELPPNYTGTTRFSILVPARNEVLNIQECLDAILLQNYPAHQFEVIVLDDFSTDKTPNIVQNYSDDRVRLIQLSDHVDPENSKAFKKLGLTLGIQQAQFEHIVTTDADCTMERQWLSQLAYAFEQSDAVMLAAPVLFRPSNSVLGQFQQLDFMAMMGVNAAGIGLRWHYLGNGANLAYSKKAFEAVEGFQGIDDLASGDDLMLMQKIGQQFPNQVQFVKSLAATTYTDVKPNWPGFMSQRIRWATKTRAYPDKKVTILWALIWMYVTGMVICLATGLFLDPNMLWILLFMLCWKAFWDYRFLSQLAAFFDRKSLLAPRSFLRSFFLENAYIFVIGILGNVVKEYRWKGRKTR